MLKETELEEIKKDLPNFPEEIIKQWLLPISQNYGWPPKQHNDWSSVLLNKSCDYWREIIWKKEIINLDDNYFNIQAISTSNLIINKFGKNDNYCENSCERISNVIEYIKKTGLLPVPPIFIFNLSLSEYKIVDGNHRFAAYRMFRNKKWCNNKQTVWIGNLPSKEKEKDYYNYSFYWGNL